MKRDLVEEALDSVVEQLESDGSKRVYRVAWARFTVWLEAEGVSVIEVKPKHVIAHVAHLRAEGLKRSTIGHTLSIVREVFGALVRDEVIESNPAREVKNPKTDHTPKTPHLSADEVARLLDFPVKDWRDGRDRLCLHLLFGLGWRASEVARMKIEDFADGVVDGKPGKTVTGIVKGKKSLTVGVPAWLWEMVHAWCCRGGDPRAKGALLPRAVNDPRPMSYAMVYDCVERAAARAGLKISPHGLRRSNITIGGERGVGLRERQLSVGHANQATTERYDRARDATRVAPGSVFEDLVKK